MKEKQVVNLLGESMEKEGKANPNDEESINALPQTLEMKDQNRQEAIMEGKKDVDVLDEGLEKQEKANPNPNEQESIVVLKRTLEMEMENFIQLSNQVAFLNFLRLQLEKLSQENLKNADVLRDRLLSMGAAPSIIKGGNNITKKTSEFMAHNLREIKEDIAKYREFITSIPRKEESKIDDVLDQILEANNQSREVLEKLEV